MEERGAAPLSFSQDRMWFIARLYPGSFFYNVPVAHFLYGRLDMRSLERALEVVVGRQAALRTSIREVGGSPVQAVARPETVVVSMPVVDLRDLPGCEREAGALRLAAGVARRPFDLGEGPLLRCVLYSLGDDEHLLLLVLHHIVCDGWSMGVLFRELAIAYKAFSSGGVPSLPELRIHYPDYAVWQRHRFSGEVLERQVDYWTNKLAGAPALHELPTDRPRPAVQTFAGSRLAFTIPAPLVEKLKALSRSWRVTLFMTLLAAFKVLLYRYSGQGDIVVGSPIANRNRPELEGLIGFFVNNLALRTDISGDPLFPDLVARVRETALEAYTYQDLPFEKLVERLRPERNPSHQPVFQVMFALQNAPGDPFSLAGLRSRRAVVDIGTSLLDLVLTLEEEEGRLTGTLQYNGDLFYGDTATRLAGHYGTLLEGIAGDPERRISELPIISGPEVERILAGSCASMDGYPRQATIHGLFEQQAALSPDSVAVECGDRSLTYGQLQERSQTVASRLRRLGIGLETPVGISMERSPELLVGLLGILKAGGAYVPLDPEYPDERLSFMLEDIRATVIVTQRSLAFRLNALAGGLSRVVVLDDDGVSGERGGDVEGGGRRSPDRPGVSPSAENLAYVLYTSGSTGRPKGVAVPHRAVVRLVKGSNFARIDADELFLQFAPVSFDASTLEIWGPLLTGGRLVAAPPGALSLEEIGETIRSRGITTAWLTAGLFNLMVDEQADSLRGLRQLLFGGEAASVAHVRKAVRLLPHCVLVNGYGPTENTTFTTCHRVNGVDEDLRSIPIGRPVTGTTVYVLDRHMRLLPEGIPGELFAGGDGLARGYHDRPDLTAESFVPDPFAREEGGRLYRTGDIVRLLPGGSIEFIGRWDDQVKIRGFRIEPGEIEAAILSFPSVKEAAVLAWEDTPGERYLAAYVAPATLSTAELRAHLAARLPAYMVPTRFAFLDDLPLTASGKVDRRSLPPPDHSPVPGGSEDPRTPLEVAVAGIWRRLLGLERVGLHDNFFELGGHSLMAMRVISHIRDELGLELPLRVVFDEPTVAGMVSAVKALQHACGADAQGSR